MIKGIYGVNIAVRDLEKATLNYEMAFGVKSKPVGEQNHRSGASQNTGPEPVKVSKP